MVVWRNRRQVLGVISLDRRTGIVMYAEGPCFGLDLAANWIEVSCFTVVLSLVGADALSGSGCPFGNDGIFWVLTTGAPPHQYLLQLVLANHFLIESRYVVL